MVIAYKRIKTIPEFDVWVEQRRKNMESYAKKHGNNINLSKMEAMRLIAKDSKGIELNAEIVKKLRGLRL